MRQTQKTGKLGYRRRDNVEHEGYDGVHNEFHGELNNQNGVNPFEKVFQRMLPEDTQPLIWKDALAFFLVYPVWT